jgi:hypothetical protein
MTNTLVRIFGPVTPATGGDVLLTADADTLYTIRTLIIASVDASPVLMRLGINGTADADLVHPEVTIDAGGKGEFEGVIQLADGETLEIDVDGDVTVSAHGLVQSP